MNEEITKDPYDNNERRNEITKDPYDNNEWRNYQKSLMIIMNDEITKEPLW